jgi:hypothetical protein
MHGLAPQKYHLTIALADVVAHRRLSDRSIGDEGPFQSEVICGGGPTEFP